MNTTTPKRAEQPAQGSAFTQLRSSPRLLILMVILLANAAAVGAMLVARLQFATAITGSGSGIGSLSLVAALAGGLFGLPSGTLIDRVNPRKALLLVQLSFGVTNVGLGLLLIFAPPPFSVIVVLTFIDGILASLAVPALAATQAALVPHDARGAAEIMNLLRLGLGGIIGTIVAARFDRPGETIILCGLVTAASGVAAFCVSRSAAFERSSPEPLNFRAIEKLFATVRALPPLRRAVVADLVLRFVIPTQIVNLLLIEKGIKNAAPAIIMGGVIGVFAGNLWLARTGLGGRINRSVLRAFYGFSICIGIASLLSIGDYLVSNIPLLILLVALGSGMGIYAQGLLAALIQQRSPDDIRGRLTGGVQALRQFTLAAGVLFATVTSGVYSTQILGWTITALAAITLVSLRGFRPIGETP
ncbi:MAG: MFS transporter [Candidatus Nanopelagicales bacterium]